MGKKPHRKGGPELNAAQRRMNLAMALLRAEAAAHSLIEWSGELPPTNHEKFLALKQELMTQEIGTVGRWFSYLQLYFATVHVIIDGTTHARRKRKHNPFRGGEYAMPRNRLRGPVELRKAYPDYAKRAECLPLS